jgi:hypothetical protein
MTACASVPIARRCDATASLLDELAVRLTRARRGDMHRHIGSSVIGFLAGLTRRSGR